MIRLTCLIALLIGLASCGDVPNRAVTALPSDMPRFPTAIKPRGVARSNADLAQDFLELTFRLEGGERLPALLRREGPIRVALRSPGLATYLPEVNGVLTRMQNEAGLDIALTPDPARAQIHVHAVPRRNIQRAFPGAACFIVPGVTSWSEFRDPAGGVAQISWSRQTTLTQSSIFIPSDSTPQDTRDCLHEELAQALGPANDLFRLPDSVFNDDNFHSVLTRFDMLMLRTLYDPALRSGMSAGAVAVRLPTILDRLNPRGRGLRPSTRAPESREWKRLIERALDRRNGRGARRLAAERAIEMASAMRPTDHRLGLALLTAGRIDARIAPARAEAYFRAAYDQFAAQFGTDDIHTAHVALHLALISLGKGQFDQAIQTASRHVGAARAAENAVVLSGLYTIIAEARAALGDRSGTRNARLRALTWARYAFGDENGDIARAQAQIASYNPANS